ncbi:MAG: phosphoglycerate dehydrogenase [Deltaproteobacteria bacterium]|nr:phosphoglycerate dehydrogenase [Deltaproteobacteria bacterium]
MKVLVSDKLEEVGVKILAAAPGVTVDVKTGLTPEQLKEIIGQYDGLVIRSATKVTAEIIEAAKNLKVVGRAGIGLDNVDIPAATKRGVIVMNTPGGNVVTTAEHAISMMLSLTRNIPRGTATMKAGLWEKKSLNGREIFNKVLGVIGYGNIGKIVADRAKGLRMQVIVYDPFFPADLISKAGFEPVSLDELYSRADYITVHVPKLKDTLNLLNADAFAKMKKGVMVINCARGGIVNEADLFEAMKSGKVAGAALDVFEKEPTPADNPLLAMDNFICTPHLGASTFEAQTNVAVAVAEQIAAYLTCGTVINAVNTPSVSGDLLVQLGPLLKLGDAMGSLQAQLSEGPITDVSLEFAGDFAGLNLAPISTAVLKGLLTPVLKDDVNFVNAGIMAKERGITVSESTLPEAQDFIQLVTLKVTGGGKTHVVAGTIFGKAEPRIVAIDTFRMEMAPTGHILLIQNEDKPGAIGSIGATLGAEGLNIEKMQVGQDKGGARNFIMLATSTAISDGIVAKLRALPLVKSVQPVEL